MSMFTKALCAFILAFGFAIALSGCASSQKTQSMPKIDMSAWKYNEEDDVYYQIGIQYVANPVDTAYETLALFVPGAYFDAKSNGDGTYTVSVNKKNTVLFRVLRERQIQYRHCVNTAILTFT